MIEKREHIKGENLKLEKELKKAKFTIEKKDTEIEELLKQISLLQK